MDGQKHVLEMIADCCERIGEVTETVDAGAEPEALQEMLAKRAELLRALGIDLGRLSPGTASDPEVADTARRARAGLLVALANDSLIAERLNASMAETRQRLDTLAGSSRAAISYASHSSLMRRRGSL